MMAQKLSSEIIDEVAIARHLYAPDLDDIDLLVRSGGEKPISNFMLWQMADAYIHFTDVLWPDMDAGRSTGPSNATKKANDAGRRTGRPSRAGMHDVDGLTQSVTRMLTRAARVCPRLDHLVTRLLRPTRNHLASG